MPKQFEIVFEDSGAVVVAEMLENLAPITCENFWKSIAEPVRAVRKHLSLVLNVMHY